MSAQRPKARVSQKRIRRNHWDTVLSDSEYAEALAKVDASGLSKSAYTRQLLLGAAGARSRKRLSVDHELFKHALRELNKLGSNINQIARALNTYGVERGMDTNFAALAEVRSAIALMRGALRGKDGDGHPQG
jgi:hypothetical protein